MERLSNIPEQHTTKEKLSLPAQKQPTKRTVKQPERAILAMMTATDTPIAVPAHAKDSKKNPPCSTLNKGDFSTFRRFSDSNLPFSGYIFYELRTFRKYIPYLHEYNDCGQTRNTFPQNALYHQSAQAS